MPEGNDALAAAPSPLSRTPLEIDRLAKSSTEVVHSPSIDELIESHHDLLRCCEMCVSCITTHGNTENLNRTLLERLNDFTLVLARARRIAS